MASSMRHDIEPQPVPEEDTTAATEDTALNLGHAGLASECWPGARGMGSETRPALRLQRPARPRTRHGPRPSYPAEARFTAADSQFLTE